MAKTPFPSDQHDKFMLRLPDGMRDRIKAAADANGRSMNAEIVACLNAASPARNAHEILLDQMVKSGLVSAAERDGHMRALSSGKEVRFDFGDGHYIVLQGRPAR